MFHTIIIAGYLGRDPEMRYMPDGRPVTTFSVATNRKWTGRDGQLQEETIWFRVSAFDKLAETCNQYLAKGRPVLVEGRLRADPSGGPRIWTGNDGTARASFEVTASTVRFLGRKDEGAPAAPAAAVPEYEEGGGEEEIPF